MTERDLRDLPRPRLLASLLGAALLLTTVAGCGDGGPGTGQPGPVGVDLDGSWTLVSGRDARGVLDLAGRNVTLRVDGAEAGGTSACNHYFGTVAVDGDTVTFSGVGGTEMGCEPAVMELEQRYLAALTAVEHAGRSDTALTLSGPDVELDLERDAPVPDSPLAGTSWTLDSLLDADMVSSVLPGGSLRLDAGTLTGDSGCRSFRGRYELEGDTLVVVELEEVAPAGPCAAGLRAQHRHVVAVLRGPATAVVDADRLVLTAADGRGLVLRASP